MQPELVALERSTHKAPAIMYFQTLPPREGPKTLKTYYIMSIVLSFDILATVAPKLVPGLPISSYRFRDSSKKDGTSPLNHVTIADIPFSYCHILLPTNLEVDLAQDWWSPHQSHIGWVVSFLPTLALRIRSCKLTPRHFL